MNLRSFKPSQYEQRRPGRREEDRRHAKPDKDDGGTEGGESAGADHGSRGEAEREPKRHVRCSVHFAVRSSCCACAREAPGARVCQREGACCVRASVFFPLAGMPAGRQNDSPNSSPNWVRVGVGAPTNGAALRGHVTHFVMLCPCPSDITLATALSAASAEDRLSLETSARTASRSWRRRTARWSLPAGAPPSAAQSASA